MPQTIVTLSEKICEDQHCNTEASGALSNVLEHVALAAKVVSREVNRAGLVDVLGLTGEENCQGEAVRKLDTFANDKFVEILRRCRFVAGMASEEIEEFIPVEQPSPDARYLVLFDPLDGSSNIDANVSIGTIFSVLRKDSSHAPATGKDFLQPGFRQVVAGYVIYGSSTVFVYTAGNGVHGFTLDPSIGEFVLSHPDIQTPKRGKIFSANLGNVASFDDKLKRYLQHLVSERNAGGKAYSLRYIGSLVADFHRNLLYGGVFFYPADSRHACGKLRLLYEASPLAWIVQHAGGRASTGTQDILEVEPTQLHQRVPLFIGSADDVAEAEAFLAAKTQAPKTPRKRSHVA